MQTLKYYRNLIYSKQDWIILTPFRHNGRYFLVPLLRVIVSLLATVWFVTACSDIGQKPIPPIPVSIVYSGNMDGELEPCGCTEEGDFGGIRRRATLIQQLRKSTPALFLISSGGLIASNSPQDALIGQFIFSGIDLLDYDAVALQWQDLAFGLDVALASAIPWVVTNAKHPNLSKLKSSKGSINESIKTNGSIKNEALLHKGNAQLAVFAWLEPANAPDEGMTESHGQLVVEANAQALSARLKALKQQGYITVLLSTLPLPEAQQTFPLQAIDILTMQSAYEVYSEPQRLNHPNGNMTLVLQPGSRGMRLGRLDLLLNARGKIQSFEHSILPLANNVPDAQTHQGWYDEYNTAVKADYEMRVARKAAQSSGQSPYKGAQACQACHAESFKIWQKSRHAHAFDTLTRVKKSFDPSCIPCHVVGFNETGGFLDDLITEELSHVQCESCHGAARTHAANPTQPTPNKDATSSGAICETCHNQKHSPSFSFTTYWPKIRH